VAFASELFQTYFKCELNFRIYLHNVLALKRPNFGTCPEESKADEASLTALFKHRAISTKKAKYISLNAILKVFSPQKAKSILSTLWHTDGLFRLFLSAMHTVESIRLLCVALRPRF